MAHLDRTYVGMGTSTGTDTMPNYRYKSRSHIRCSVKVCYTVTHSGPGPSAVPT